MKEQKQKIHCQICNELFVPTEDNPSCCEDCVPSFKNDHYTEALIQELKENVYY